MANIFHKDFTDDNNHALTARTYADIAARDADTLFQVAANLNKIVRIDSPAQYFVLFSVGPAVWIETSSTGSENFIQLLDTPASYSGQAGLVAQVNAGETALEFGQDLTATGTPTFASVSGVDVGTDVPLNTTHRGSDGTDHSDVVLNNTHRGSDGSDHGFLDQAVTVAGTPQFASLALGGTLDATSILTLTSTTKGLLLPRLTTGQRNVFPSPIKGLMIYNTTLNKVEQFTGILWDTIGNTQGTVNSADNSIVRWNGTVGKDIQDSGVLIDDSDNMTGVNNLTVTGNLTVQGTTTTLDTATLLVEDKNIELGVVGSPSDATADGGGITLKGATDKTITWVNATDSWDFNQDINIAGNLLLSGTVDGIDIAAFIDQSVAVAGTPQFASLALGGTLEASSLLSVTSTTKGFLPPRMTTTQRDNIASPANGLQIYNTTTDDQEFFNGVVWQSMGGGDVTGPASAVDGDVAVFNGTSGKNLKTTLVKIASNTISTTNALLKLDAGTGGLTDRVAFLTPAFEVGVGQVIATVSFVMPTVVGDRVKIGRINMRGSRGLTISMQIATQFPMRIGRKYEIITGDSFTSGLREVIPSQEGSISDLSADDFTFEIDTLGSNMHLYARRIAGTGAVNANFSAQFVSAGILNDTGVWVDDGGATSTVTAPTTVMPTSMIRQTHDTQANSLDLDHLRFGNGSTIVDINGQQVMPDNMVVIAEASDMPTTLVTGKHYLIVAPITIEAGNEITIPNAASITIESSDRINNNITYTGTGTLFTSAAQTGSLTFLKIDFVGNGSTSKLMDLTGSGFPGMFMDSCNINGWGAVSLLDGFGGGIAIGKIGGSGNANGIFSVSDSVFFGVENAFFQNFSDTNSNFFTIAADVGRVAMTLVGVVTQPGENVFLINSSFTGEVIVNTQFGTPAGQLFDPAGLDGTSIFIKVSTASNQPDSTTSAELFLTGNTLETQIPAAGALVEIATNQDWTGEGLEQMTISTDGVAAYIGLSAVTLGFSGNINIEPATASKSLSVRSVSLDSPITVVTFGSGTNVINETATALVNGDTISFRDTAGTLPAEIRDDVVYFVVTQAANSFQISYTSGGAAIAFTDDGSGTNSYKVADLHGATPTTTITAGSPRDLIPQANIPDITDTESFLVVMNNDDAVNVLVNNGYQRHSE